VEDIIAEQEANADHHIHLPSPSYWPIVLAFALPIIAYGVIYNRLFSVVGIAIMILACSLGDGALGGRRVRVRPGAAGERWPRHRAREHDRW
jgi:hypothetical protein